MARASRRLAILVAPAAIDRPGWAPLALAALRAAGLSGEASVAGGHGEIHPFDEPAPRFLANGQGGFHVRCPATGLAAARAFSRALEAWRAGGPRSLRCPCGDAHALEDLDVAPPALFARSWVEIADARSAELTPAAVATLEGLGGVRIAWRRG